MIFEIIENKQFSKINYTQQKLESNAFEHCEFTDCDFSSTDLSDYSFTECSFKNCNLSMAILKNTAFKDVKFKNCKLMGLIFFDCNKFLLTLNFENCNLSYAIFYKLKLKKTTFKGCLLQEVDFTETDLSNSIFDNCDFVNAQFDFTNLEKSDLRTSFNYFINPERNRIKKAKFSLHGISGLLTKYDIVIE